MARENEPDMDQASINRAYKSDYGSAGIPKLTPEQKIANMMARMQPGYEPVRRERKTAPTAYQQGRALQKGKLFGHPETTLTLGCNTRL